MGRVTEQLLLAHCAEVDLVEPSRHLLAAARASLAPSTSARDGGAAGDGGTAAAAARGYPPGHAAAGFFEMGLQAFSPAPKRRARARPRASVAVSCVRCMGGLVLLCCPRPCSGCLCDLPPVVRMLWSMC